MPRFTTEHTCTHDPASPNRRHGKTLVIPLTDIYRRICYGGLDLTPGKCHGFDGKALVAATAKSFLPTLFGEGAADDVRPSLPLQYVSRTRIENEMGSLADGALSLRRTMGYTELPDREREYCACVVQEVRREEKDQSKVG